MPVLVLSRSPIYITYRYVYESKQPLNYVVVSIYKEPNRTSTQNNYDKIVSLELQQIPQKGSCEKISIN